MEIREMAWWLKLCTAVAKDLGVVAITSSGSFNSRGSNAILASAGTYS